LENYTSDIVYYQLWQSVDQVDLKLSYIPLITEKKSFEMSVEFQTACLKTEARQPQGIFVFKVCGQ
jgi:hypothetical protein